MNNSNLFYLKNLMSKLNKDLNYIENTSVHNF